MPDMNMQVFEEAQRNQLVTDVDIQSQVSLDDYQVKLSDIANPTQSQDNAVIDSGVGFLQHWNESLDFDTWINTSIGVSGKRLLMLCGDSISNGGSNMSSTFPTLNEDFEDGTVDKWTVESGATFSAQSTIVKYGTYSGKEATTGTDLEESFIPFSAQNDSFIVEFDVLWEGLDDTSDRKYLNIEKTGLDYLNAIDFIIDAKFGTKRIEYYDGAAHSVMNINSDQWYHWKLIIYPITDTFDLYVDDVSKVSGGGTRGTCNSFAALSLFSFNSESTDGQFIDNIFIRKHTTIEPAVQIGTPKNISTALESFGRAG